MKVSDFIVEKLIGGGIQDVFGYPGGMVTHLMDSFDKYKDRIRMHLTYHEQGAAFAACGYAQTSGKIGVAYATSGPGATNLITGICNAYYDSIPTLFLTGQVNTYEDRGEMGIRQRGFQETDIISMVQTVTVFAKKVKDKNDIPYLLHRAMQEAMTGRKGPVVLDIPMDILRSDIGKAEFNSVPQLSNGFNPNGNSCGLILEKYLGYAKRPVLLLGNGIKGANAQELCKEVIQKLHIPVVTTMPAVDLASFYELMYGFVGAYGTRTANFIIAKSDLIISIGSRLDIRQVGAVRSNFAPQAQIIRIDIDAKELDYTVHENDINICTDAKDALLELMDEKFTKLNFTKWLDVCYEIKRNLKRFDDRKPNILVNCISKYLQDNTIITTDVGQNQIWIAQSLKFKKNQIALFSGGHGAMGYSLPAAIGAALASGNRVYCFTGDGGLQMNIQELHTVIRENLPIKIILLNNRSLGMIRHFQEMYFDGNYTQTVPERGYTVPDFEAIAKAYKFPYYLIENVEDIQSTLFDGNTPAFIEVRINEPTYVVPKLRYGNPNQDQEPLIDRNLFKYLMDL